MDMLGLIRKKRAGGELAPAEVQWLVQGAVRGAVPDYQIAAWLMAVCYEHLTFAETLALTRAFLDSGAMLDWSGSTAPVVDKHSTGGVGDKVSLVLVPWLAAAGLIVPKMSGRGLGHTGGTIDKLESIPGFRVDLSPDEVRRQLQQVGCAVVAQSAALVPADKQFYALRDATDTVAELGLIAASVLSKKLAGGAQHIVLDVKCGTGAFFPDLAAARQFATLACRLGAEFNRRVGYVISAMDQPLGRAIGNALEVAEALAVFDDPAVAPDLVELCLELGAVLLVSAGRAEALPAGRAVLRDVLAVGDVKRRFTAWIQAQGGDLAAFRDELERRADYRRIAVPAPSTGVVQAVDGRGLGEVARGLGAGRLRAGDTIDPLVGLSHLAKIGESVNSGDTLAMVWASPADARSDQALQAAVLACYQTGAEPAAQPAVVLETSSAD